MASWRSAGAELTEGFCFGLVPKAAEAQHRAIARYDSPGRTSVDEFLQHMLRLGNFARELCNQPAGATPPRAPQHGAQVHHWLTAAEGDCPPPPAHPSRDFVASLRAALWSVAPRRIPTPTGTCSQVSRSTSGARSSHRWSSDAIP